MSVSLMLFLVAIAASIVLFADSAMQWSLRLMLDGGLGHPPAKPEATEPAAAPPTPAPPAKAA